MGPKPSPGWRFTYLCILHVFLGTTKCSEKLWLKTSSQYQYGQKKLGLESTVVSQFMSSENAGANRDRDFDWIKNNNENCVIRLLLNHVYIGSRLLPVLIFPDFYEQHRQR